MRQFIFTILLSLISTLAIAQNGNFNDFNSSGKEVNFEKTDVFLPLTMKLDNPCEDSLYLELKEIPLDEMTDRQFEVFKEKDRACNEYLNTVEATAADKKNAETFEKANNTYKAVIAISLISAVASAIYLSTLDY